MSAQLLYYSR